MRSTPYDLDVMESGMEGEVVVERSEMGLLDWINANRGSMGGGDVELR